MSITKKFRKLRRDPELFVSDMFANRLSSSGLVAQAVQNLPVPIAEGVSSVLGSKALHQFSVVSAVYNVEPYLDDFLNSLVVQTISFRKNIQLILVDDGSTDGSTEKIEQWCRRYPENIIVVKKENGGQASARNLGMKHVCHPWVTFIDPDDFVSSTYFQLVDRALKQEEPIDIVSCPRVFFHEKDQSVVDGHPLRYRFEEGTRTVDAYTDRDALQLSSATGFFQTSRILKFGLTFDETLRPTFEDAKFVLEYLRVADTGNIHFLAEATYFYRKRSDGSSTLDRAWSSADKFVVQPRIGYLAVLESYQSSHGYVPDFVQWTVLYDLTWYFKYLLENRIDLGFLSPEEQQVFLDTLYEIFAYIDEDNILDFSLAGAWFFHKSGWLSLFKKKSPPSQIVYIDDYDSTQELVKLRHFHRGDSDVSYRWGEKDIFPTFSKFSRHSLANLEFLRERNSWIAIDKVAYRLSVLVDGSPARLSLGGTQSSIYSYSQIAHHFEQRRLSASQPGRKAKAIRSQAAKPATANRYRDAWLFMDRDTQADDNAEHLYRFAKAEHPEINSYFLLNSDSHDWDRLSAEGFRLIAHGSLEHKLALLNCAHMISSHADHYVLHFLSNREFGDKLKGKFTFLQHGVTKDDISGWLNPKRIDRFITSARREYESIAGPHTPYKYTARETVLTGFPRHDRLVRDKGMTEKVILIMPTWRNDIVGKVISGNTREINPDFMKTDFAVAWQELFSSKELESACVDYGYRVIVFPHLNIQPYAKMFTLPSYMEVLDHGSCSMQDLMIQARFVVTDYSSVAFEMAIMGKPTVYYQFDAGAIYSGNHVYTKGYYDYHADGFGPVCDTSNEVTGAILQILENDGMPDETSVKRMGEFFELRDGNACRRTIQSILALDENSGTAPSREDLECHASASTVAQDWPLARARWQHVIDVSGSPSDEKWLIRLAEAHAHLGEFEECSRILERVTEGCEGLDAVRATVSLAIGDWATAKNRWTQLWVKDPEKFPTAPLRIAKAERSLGELREAAKWLERVSPGQVDARELLREQVALLLAQKAPSEAADKVASFIEDGHGTNKDHLLLMLCLRFAGRLTHRNVGEREYRILLRFAQDESDDSTTGMATRAEIANGIGQLELAHRYWLAIVESQDETLTPIEHLCRCTAARRLGMLEDARSHLVRASGLGNASFELTVEAGALELARGNYAQIEETWSRLPELIDLHAYEHATLQGIEAKTMQGKAAEAEALIIDFAAKFPCHPSGLLAKLRVTIAAQDWSQAVDLWSSLRDHCSDELPSDLRMCIVEGLRSEGKSNDACSLLLLDAEHRIASSSQIARSAQHC